MSTLTLTPPFSLVLERARGRRPALILMNTGERERIPHAFPTHSPELRQQYHFYTAQQNAVQHGAKEENLDQYR